MALPRKRVSIGDRLGEAQDALYDLVVEQPKAWLAQARERMRDLPKANFELGCNFAERGHWLDALFRFRVVVFLQPNYPQVWYNLGCCYFRTGRLPQAKQAFVKALAQKPGDTESLFMLAAIDPASVPVGQRPTRMPLSLVTGFFSSLAEGYDIAEARQQYQAGKVIHELLRPLVKNPAPVVVELACGSGIVARPWRAAAKEMVGVDVTPSMVALAKKATHAEKKLFDHVITADVAQLPETMTPQQADLVLLINAVQFVGDLGEVFKGATRLMKPGAVLAITVEPHSESAGFGLSRETGRFGHSAAYVKQAAAGAGLALVKETSVALYPELPVQAFVFSKGGI